MIVCYAVLAFMMDSCKPRLEHYEFHGLTYDWIRRGDQRLPARDDIVLFHFVAIDSEDSVWINTYKKGLPMSSLIGDSSRMYHETNFKKLTRTLSAGDSLNLTFTKAEFNKQLLNRPDPGKPGLVHCRLSVDRIIPVEAYHTWMDILAVKIRKKRAARQGRTIDSVLLARNLKADVDRSGIRYILHQASAGHLQPGDTVEMMYKASLLDGSLPWSSDKTSQHPPLITDVPSRFVVDSKTSIRGINNAVKILGRKGSGVFYIPSALLFENFGDLGAQEGIVYFEIKIIDVRSGLPTPPK